ncbi:MAG TPA: mandelate racemase/muconate lactonizing enzyme family protein [Dehalococcoidia bacterium]
MRSLAWRPFRIPFRAGFATARGTLTHREGWLVRLDAGDGLTGLGEAAPLAGHGPSGEAAGRPVPALLAEARAALTGAPLEAVAAYVDGLAAPGAAAAAVRCALDTALHDVLGRASGRPVASLLAAVFRPAVPVNATVAAAGAEEAAAAAAAARDAGFRCIKLKVGMAPDPEAERARVAAVRSALGADVALRLDANGAWSAAAAVRTIRTLEPYGIELVEQPVPPGDPAALRAVREAVAVPVAADEDITSEAAARRVLEAGAADVLVVKPAAVGGLRAGRRIAAMAAEAGAAALVTTMLEAGVGTAAALHLAAALPAGGPACGLATLPLLAASLVAEPPAVRDGAMALPPQAGLGVTPDETQLAAFAGAAWEVAAGHAGGR